MLIPVPMPARVRLGLILRRSGGSLWCLGGVVGGFLVV